MLFVGMPIRDKTHYAERECKGIRVLTKFMEHNMPKIESSNLCWNHFILNKCQNHIIYCVSCPLIGLIFGQAWLLTNSTIIFTIYKIYCTLNWPCMVINIELEWCQSPHHCQLNALLLCLLFVVCSYA